MIRRMVLFGASGDLAGRYLLPALAALAEADRLPPGFRLLGAADDDWDDSAFRGFAAERLETFAADLRPSVRDRLLDSLGFHRVDLSDGSSVRAALGRAREDARNEALAAYLALPPALFSRTISALGQAALPAGSRIAVEKPFGENLERARELNTLLRRAAGAAGEQAIFRVDHVLGMETTQELVRLRLGGTIPDSIWNGAHIGQVDLLWEETLALEGRARYYDHAGALKDVVQNHLMQLLCLVAMETPKTSDEEELRDAKVAVLRGVAGGDPRRRSRRGRYGAGRIGEREVPAYADEDGVDPDRRTETFAEVSLELEAPRWGGTGFVLRGAKAMAERRKGVLVRFRSPVSLPFGSGSGDELWIGIDGPDEIRLTSTDAREGQGRRPPQADSPRGPTPPRLPAYAHVLASLLEGKRGLSVRGDEAEEAWRVVEPVLESWVAGEVPLLSYPAGSRAV